MLYTIYDTHTGISHRKQARDIKLRAKREKKRETEVIRDLLNKGFHTSRSINREITGEALLLLARLGEKYTSRRLLICIPGLMITCMETNSYNLIIADTSGLVSLFSHEDQNHEMAVQAAKRLGDEHKDILVPAAVFVELLNILGHKVGHDAAVAAISELTPLFLVLNEPNNIPEIPALKQIQILPPSVRFTDCIVMALDDEYSTRDIFGFDKQCEDAGYRRREPSTEWEEAS